MSSTRPPLTGHTILVTRPAHQADTLCRLITQAGGQPRRYPTLAIDPCIPADAQARLADIHAWDGIIFVSANAVSHALAHIPTAIRPDLRVAAVGASSAHALSTAGFQHCLAPTSGFRSEDLLKLPELNAVHRQRWLIVRGATGRERLAQTLRQRGATVAYAQVYRRTLPTDPTPAYADWLRHRHLHAVTCASPDGLNNLITLTPAALRPTLCTLALVVISERMVKIALSHGFRQVRTAASALDSDVLQCLIDRRCEPTR